VNFLMSGESAGLDSITALAAQGYECVHLTFNADSDWLSLTWLSVVENLSAGTAGAGAIARTVLRVDPGALRI
jgi:hypothetical protein